MAKPTNTTDRGYGRDHQQERAAWAPFVERGEVYCAELICLMPDRWIQPGSEWDLAHDRRTGGYLGPAHAKCNRTEGGKAAHAPRSARWSL